jgi:spore germination protein GerM
MSSVTSVSAGVADLFQTFAPAAGSPLSSASLQSTLENASPRDVVQLSRQALRLQESGSLFGTATTTQTATDPAALLLQAVTSSLTGTPGTSG